MQRMKQRTLAMMTGFERYTKKRRRAVFLEEMGAGSAVARAVRADRAALSQAGPRSVASSRGSSGTSG